MTKPGVMRVDGVERPWWWYPGQRPWLGIGIPAACSVYFALKYLFAPSTYTLVAFLLFAGSSAATSISVVFTRRTLEWERREF